ncbi:MAG: xanthine dehydrogenase family protein molybdopterin-binding subunit [Acidimicrobiales bacterium]
MLGRSVVRVEDRSLLTSGGVYLADLPIHGAAWVTYVRSTTAHARLRSVDVAEALAAPGVLGVFTGEDTAALGPAPLQSASLNPAMSQPFIARDIVRFVGEPVAVIVSATPAEGADAADLLSVSYEALPPVVDPTTALEGDILLFPAATTNVAWAMGSEPDERLFDDCEIVVRQRLVNQRVAPCPLEVRCGMAQWDDDGLIQWAGTQNPHGFRDVLAKLYGLCTTQVRVITPPLGGAFGAKGDPYPDELLLGWIARRIGAVVRWVETRSESMVAMGHGRGQIQDIVIGGSRDGTIQSYRLEILQDAGAYPQIGAVLPRVSIAMAPGPYGIRKVAARATAVVTNTTPMTAYRGAGQPEATAALERAVDLFAAEIDMDPADLRRRNLIARSDFPFTTPTGVTYDTGDYRRALDLALSTIDYAGYRRTQAAMRAEQATVQLGIGLSTYVGITGEGSHGEFGSVQVLPTGRVVARTGLSPHGQGHATALAMLIADQLGVRIDDVEVVHGDTDHVPSGHGTMGSRSLQQGGAAIQRAGRQVAELGRQVAAELLEADPGDVVLDRARGQFHVAGVPTKAVCWRQVASAAGALHDGRVLQADVDADGAMPTFPFGTHVAVVEVDTQTGRVRLLRLVAVDDAGRILNPLLAEGQVHGGLAQGVGQALLEEVRYDADGTPQTANLMDYGCVSATDLPSFETRRTETPTPLNPLGAKGIGESGTIGSTPAVLNAVVDALSYLGVRHLDMPCTSERVWRAINRAVAGP